MVDSSDRRRAKPKGASMVARSRSRIEGAARWKAKSSSITSDGKVELERKEIIASRLHNMGRPKIVLTVTSAPKVN
jgi:hypothetical protein